MKEWRLVQPMGYLEYHAVLWCVELVQADGNRACNAGTVAKAWSKP
jgi:hypothetical protein